MLLFKIMLNIVFSIILGPSIKIFANRRLPPTEKRCQSTSNQALPLSTGSGNDKTDAFEDQSNRMLWSILKRNSLKTY